MNRAQFVIAVTGLLLAPWALPLAAESDSSSSAPLVAAVRRATEHFKDVAVATQAGYARFLGCVSGPAEGAMGVHFVNGGLVGDGVLDAARPEALMYEPKNGGGMELVGVEYIVIADDWHKANQAPPTLMGQVFHYTGSPNRYGIPAFYALHVWAWKQNRNGTFADWNPKVSCASYTP